jgi:hypothetical protein
MRLIVLISFIAALVLGGCGGGEHEGGPSSTASEKAANAAEWEAEAAPAPEPTMEPIPAELLSATPEQLCSKLAEIKTIPTFNPTPTDPIYEALMAKGKDAIPCLVEKISDVRRMLDPRYSVPTWRNFAVGDAAVFILVRILRRDDDEREKLLIEMLPPKSRNEWEDNGIYAYFNYVSEPKNRKQLQQWWSNWLKNNNK